MRSPPARGRDARLEGGRGVCRLVGAMPSSKVDAESAGSWVRSPARRWMRSPTARGRGAQLEGGRGVHRLVGAMPVRRWMRSPLARAGRSSMGSFGDGHIRDKVSQCRHIKCLTLAALISCRGMSAQFRLSPLESFSCPPRSLAFALASRTVGLRSVAETRLGREAKRTVLRL
jgi:hypothetical protein